MSPRSPRSPRLIGLTIESVLRTFKVAVILDEGSFQFRSLILVVFCVLKQPPTPKDVLLPIRYGVALNSSNQTNSDILRDDENTNTGARCDR